MDGVQTSEAILCSVNRSVGVGRESSGGRQARRRSQLSTDNWGLGRWVWVGWLASYLAIAHGPMLLLCMRSWQKPGPGGAAALPPALGVLQCCCTGVSVQCGARYPTENALHERAAVSESTLRLTVASSVQSRVRTVPSRTAKTTCCMMPGAGVFAMLSVQESKTGGRRYSICHGAPQPGRWRAALTPLAHSDLFMLVAFYLHKERRRVIFPH